MKISVINLTHGLISDQEIQAAIRAVNRQVQEDFAPYWNISGQLRLEGSSGGDPNRGENTEDMRGDAVIYIWDEADVPNALGYHDANHHGVPFGFVFVDIATEMGENWTVTFSHEVLELLGDRQANLLVQGPHPDDGEQLVYHWREMCDAVQADIYEIDGVEVSNFVLPLYFTPGAEKGGRNDFLGQKNSGQSLDSFGINPGGYVGFYDPTTGVHETRMGAKLADPVVEPLGGKVVGPEYRQRRKNKARGARRGYRYQASSNRVSKATHSKRTPFRASSGKHRLKMKWSGADLEINKRPVPIDDVRNRAGSYAHNIYASGKTLQRHLDEDDFHELERLAFEVDAIDGQGEEIPAKLELEVSHRESEVLFAMTEVDGVLLWYQCSNPRAKTNSKFTIPVVASTTGSRALRAGLFSNAKKTVVRFFKHKILKRIEKKIKKDLTSYLADTIEKTVFNKPDPLVMKEFFPLPRPSNNTLARIGKMRKPLKENQDCLLFVHGIFSSIEGAFGDLLLSRHNDQLIRRLKYDRIIGADHWTVASSTLDNARDLLKKLPDNCNVDMVCHSRGAGVVRCLLEHPELIDEVRAKNIDFGKVVFVAGACQGSPLAHPKKIGSLVNAFSVLSSISTAYLPIKLITGLLKVVQYTVEEFPGIAAMSPESPIFTQLNKEQNYNSCQYVYMRSNYEPSSKVKRLLDEGLIDQFAFGGKGNDLVVPFDGAGTFDEGVDGSIEVIAGAEFGVEGQERDNVVHTKFFREREVRDHLLKHLSTH